MKVRANFALVFNLDKCIGCHTCSVTCKNVWTNRKGVEYVWFNNVESKPGIGYPKHWEDQEKWHGGWEVEGGKLKLKSGSRLRRLANLFANPDLPTIDDYYEPFDYDYATLQHSPLREAAPVARPYSLIDGSVLDKIEWGPNWEDDLAGEFASRSRDVNFEAIEKAVYAEFEHSFNLYLPRICNHCLNPSCVASCPSGAMYKRKEDGIVLVDQNRCRSWRMCISNCPYKKVYYNFESGKAEKCTACYPRVEAGLPTVCSETCVGRIRYNGIMLYDADRIAELAAVEDPKDLYAAQRRIFLDPNDPEVTRQALADGIPQAWIEAARKSPIWKLVMEFEVAFPLHPEFRTLPMVWYVPPLSPVNTQIDQGHLPVHEDGMIPKLEALKLPIRYLANLLTAGNEAPIVRALERMLAMRSYMRSVHVEGKPNPKVAEAVGLTEAQVKAMYQLLAIANYEDRFVIPTAPEYRAHEDIYAFQGQVGFAFGNESCSVSAYEHGFSLFPEKRKGFTQPLRFTPMSQLRAKTTQVE